MLHFKDEKAKGQKGQVSGPSLPAGDWQLLAFKTEYI
jgi:hypothetical protein